MPNATHETTIDRPPEDVFAYLANAENDTSWRPGVLEVGHIGGEGAGSRYRQVVSGPGGRRIDADIEFTEHEPGRRLAFRTIAGLIRPTGVYELEPAPGGGTHIRFTLDAQLSGLKRAMSPMVSRTMRTEVGNLENLKRVLESGAASARPSPEG